MDSDQIGQSEKRILHPHEEAFNKTTRYFVSMILFFPVSSFKLKRAISEERKNII